MQQSISKIHQYSDLGASKELPCSRASAPYSSEKKPSDELREIQPEQPQPPEMVEGLHAEKYIHSEHARSAREQRPKSPNQVSKQCDNDFLVERTHALEGPEGWMQ